MLNVLVCVVFSAHFAHNAAEGNFNRVLGTQNATGIIQRVASLGLHDNWCDCGEHAYRCDIIDGFKFCYCPMEYPEKHGKCEECNCGKNLTKFCDWDQDYKEKCHCISGYAQKDRMCAECNCGNGTNSCSFDSSGKKICSCLATHVEKNGICEVKEPFNAMIIVYTVIPILIVIGVIVFLVIRRRRANTMGIGSSA